MHEQWKAARTRRGAGRLAAAVAITASFAWVCTAGAPATPAAADRVTVTVLATTDMHGYILPYDYYTRTPAAHGLAKAATLIRKVRTSTPHTLLVDCGDTIQGSPLESVHQSAVRAGRSRAPDPMMLAMNALQYDAMAVGNHEYNYGLSNLRAARQTARFPWISANTRTSPAVEPFAPFVVRNFDGVRVAIVGITTPVVPQWERPEHISGLSWIDPEQAVAAALDALAPEAPDAVILAVHGGLGPEGTDPAEAPAARENPVRRLARRFPHLTAIVYGHTHRSDPGTRIGSVLLVQPRNWAREVARLDLAFTRDQPSGRWRLAEARSELLPVTAGTPADPEILAIAGPYHAAAERELNRRVAHAPRELSGARGRVEDSALVDAIHEVQLHYARADVSLSALFDPRVRVARGPVTVRELAALYPYDNELYAVAATGRTLRAALENAARYYGTCPDPACASGPLLDRSVPGYNFDMAQGVEYEIDLTRPVGDRIRNLRRGGVALEDDEPLRIAVNSYRAAGSAGYDMLRDAPVVWRSGRDIRDLMVEYYAGVGQLPEAPDRNWRIVPPAAVQTILRELQDHR